MSGLTIDIIRNFCRTYNTVDFKKLPCNIKELFLNESLRVLRGDVKGFAGLAYIIRNIMVPMAYTKVDYILNGIVGLAYMEGVLDSNNVKVYLFDDTHVRETNCRIQNAMSIEKFILEQITTATDFVDLYIENKIIAGSEKINVYNTTMMYNITHSLRDCFTVDKSKCPFPHLRAHYVDARIERISGLLYIVNQAANSYRSLGMTPRTTAFAEKMKHNLGTLRNVFSSQTSIKNYIQERLRYSKISKQISHNTKDVQDAISVMSENWIDSFLLENIKYLTFETISRLLYYIKNDLYILNFSEDEEKYTVPQLKALCLKHNIKYTTKKESLSKLSLIQGKIKTDLFMMYFLFSGLDAIFMDVYAIARLFRTYTYTPKRYSGPARNIIIYAGGFHTERYRSFLTYLNFKMIASAYGKQSLIKGSFFPKYDCINVSLFKQPFFTD